MPTRAKSGETQGHCACKRIKYAFDGDPLWVAHCHCETCRRATSSAFATYVGVKLDQFRYYEGEPSWYESSPGVHRYFCGHCGSPMAYIGDKFAGTVHLYAGSLAEPDKVRPTGNLNAQDRVPWTDVHKELPELADVGDLTRKGPGRK